MVKERRLQRESAAAAVEEVKRGAWTAEEDRKLVNYVAAHGHKHWRALPSKAGMIGLKRCGKSCRLRWLNYLRPGIKRGNISQDEEDLIIRLHNLLGNRWSIIAGRIPGRTDNEIKNHWNTRLRKRSLSIEDLNNKQQNHSTTDSTVTVLTSPPAAAAAVQTVPEYSSINAEVTPSTLQPADEQQGPAANSLRVDQVASELGNERLSEFSNELGLDGFGLLPSHHDNNKNQDQFFEFEDLEQYWLDYQPVYALNSPISG